MARARFEDFKFNRQLLDAASDAGFEFPTEIQCKAFPPVLSGQDVLGVAQTGTGKTAAFVMPILMKLSYAQGEHPRALLLAPTRELAMQTAEHTRVLAKHTDLRTVELFGGVGMKGQIEALKQGADLVVATPGRLLDLYLAGHLVLRSVEFLVLDEADKMMDMGFVDSLHRILEILPRKRQNLLFSATMGEAVHRISGDFLTFPTVVEVSEQATPAVTVEQALYFVPNLRTKFNLLRYLLSQEETFQRCLVFCRTRAHADQVYRLMVRFFGEDEVRVIHANKGQNTRINAMRAFKEGEIRMLVSTDVSARGIDVSNVSHVINFDVPIVIADYVHRIGRTGRAFRKGSAISFCDPSEIRLIDKIEKLIRQTIPVLEIPAEVVIEETGKEEHQKHARAIDAQRRKENPEFKGAFHEKKAPPKRYNSPTKSNQKKRRGNRKSR